MLRKVLRLTSRKSWRAIKSWPMRIATLPWRVAKAWPWRPQRRKTERFVKKWQTPLSALVGFSGVVATLAYSGYKDRAIKLEEENRTARALAIGLYAEMVFNYDAFGNIAMDMGMSRYYLRKDGSPEDASRCIKQVEAAREVKWHRLGIFEAGTSVAGRLPVDLLIQFLRAKAEVDRFGEGAEYRIKSCQESRWSFYIEEENRIAEVAKEMRQYSRLLRRHYPSTDVEGKLGVHFRARQHPRSASLRPSRNRSEGAAEKKQ
jgi:hypothetical protein